MQYFKDEEDKGLFHYSLTKKTEYFRVYFVGSTLCADCKHLLPDFERLIVAPLKKVDNMLFFYVNVDLIEESLYEEKVFPEVTQLPHIVVFPLSSLSTTLEFHGQKILSECGSYIKSIQDQLVSSD